MFQFSPGCCCEEESPCVNCVNQRGEYLILDAGPYGKAAMEWMNDCAARTAAGTASGSGMVLSAWGTRNVTLDKYGTCCSCDPLDDYPIVPGPPPYDCSNFVFEQSSGTPITITASTQPVDPVFGLNLVPEVVQVEVSGVGTNPDAICDDYGCSNIDGTYICEKTYSGPRPSLPARHLWEYSGPGPMLKAYLTGSGYTCGDPIAVAPSYITCEVEAYTDTWYGYGCDLARYVSFLLRISCGDPIDPPPSWVKWSMGTWEAKLDSESFNTPHYDFLSGPPPMSFYTCHNCPTCRGGSVSITW